MLMRHDKLRDQRRILFAGVATALCYPPVVAFTVLIQELSAVCTMEFERPVATRAQYIAAAQLFLRRLHDLGPVIKICLAHRP